MSNLEEARRYFKECGLVELASALDNNHFLETWFTVDMKWMVQVRVEQNGVLLFELFPYGDFRDKIYSSEVFKTSEFVRISKEQVIEKIKQYENNQSQNTSTNQI